MIRCEMRRRVDKKLRQVVEIVSSAPLSCSVETASGSLWGVLTSNRSYIDKTYRYVSTEVVSFVVLFAYLDFVSPLQVQPNGPNAIGKSFDQILRGTTSMTPVNGLQVAKRFEEADRVVLTVAHRMLVPTAGLHLGGNTWITFSRSETDPAGACEIHSFMQLYVEIQPGFSASPNDMAYFRDAVFEAWSTRMRTYAQRLQGSMIEAASSAPIGASQLLLVPAQKAS
ncbi:unnamed protein product [Phytophthora fragariaefolia]|uniref:Unnamed protein product n=1 Tax=Phytophthora fragariaefolia TaxID=1490495 RepID=A0A9W7D9L4_9STRA|nr:unnamed protein product [Phytophthora fragariaefolia]